ncbi:MAG TPA: hypothetical protein VII94_06280, partial [Candidatus Saccharimonadales bacterium]
MANLCCSNELNLDKMCVDCAKMNCAKIQQVISDNICSQLVSANQVSANMIGANSICVKAGTINTLCVDNLSIGNFSPYTKYRATVNFSGNTTYTLGANLPFNNIIDDPNNNVSISPFMSYTAPVAGYYELSYIINANNLISTGGAILGVPVANPEIFVNGALAREIFAPFLSFLGAQNVILSTLITLQAGDVVTLQYNVLGGSGIPAVGTIDMASTGAEGGNSLFKIIFMSAANSSSNNGAACVV